jgi:phosphoglycolate phosphatase
MAANMAAFLFEIVGFDLDGTLLDTSRDLAAAANHAIGLLGRPPLSVEAVTTMVGQGTRVMLTRVLEASGGCSPADLDRAYPALLDYYEAHIAAGTRLYPGLLDALDALAAREVRVGVVTNKLERLATKLLGELGLLDRFATVIGGDTVAAKPSPAPILELQRRLGGGRTAFVGDSIFDVEAAHNAGVPVVAVDFGFMPIDTHALGADAVIDRFDELVSVLEALGG